MTQRTETPAPATTVRDELTGDVLATLVRVVHYGEAYRLPVPGAARGSRADYAIMHVTHDGPSRSTAVARRVVD